MSPDERTGRAKAEELPSSFGGTLSGNGHVVIALAVALLWRLIEYYPAFTPDSQRFLEQSQSLLAGNGLAFGGRQTAALPPGYPVFLSIIALIDSSVEFLRAAQVAMSVISCWIVYRAVRPGSPRWGIAALWGMALHPMLAAYSWACLSETFAVALAAILVLLVSRALRDLGKPRERVLLGIVAGWLVLTSPAVVFLFYGLSVFLLFRRWQVRRNALAYLGGALAVIVPWQAYCGFVTGSVQPLMLQVSTSSAAFSDFARWTRTWLVSPGELRVWWDSGEAIVDLPDRAFSDPDERQMLAGARDGIRSGAIGAPEHDAIFRVAAERNIDSRPFDYYALLPIKRALMLWVYMPQIGHVDPAYVRSLLSRKDGSGAAGHDQPRAALKWAKGAGSLVVYCLYLSYTACFFGFALVAVRQRSVLALIIVFGVLAYTFGSAASAMVEVRRNLPFVPMLLFIPFLAFPRNGDGNEMVIAVGPSVDRGS